MVPVFRFRIAAPTGVCVRACLSFPALHWRQLTDRAFDLAILARPEICHLVVPSLLKATRECFALFRRLILSTEIEPGKMFGFAIANGFLS